MAEIFGAFSDGEAARLSGLSKARLRNWDHDGFFKPSYAAADRKQAYSRVYSFKDIVALRVLGRLRNEFKVSLQHLRQVADDLSHLGEDVWTATTLYVLNRRVSFDDPVSGHRIESGTGQRVFKIPLRVAAGDVEREIRVLRKRDVAEIGSKEKQRHVQGGAEVFAGTRIPLATIFGYLRDGYSQKEILSDFPSLSAQDIKFAKGQLEDDAA